jgi:hypothetical protein
VLVSGKERFVLTYVRVWSASTKIVPVTLRVTDRTQSYDLRESLDAESAQQSAAVGTQEYEQTAVVDVKVAGE